MGGRRFYTDIAIKPERNFVAYATVLDFVSWCQGINVTGKAWKIFQRTSILSISHWARRRKRIVSVVFCIHKVRHDERDLEWMSPNYTFYCASQYLRHVVIGSSAMDSLVILIKSVLDFSRLSIYIKRKDRFSGFFHSAVISCLLCEEPIPFKIYTLINCTHKTISYFGQQTR